jgi:hypothetical protein
MKTKTGGAFPWVMASTLGALVWGVPMTFLMQRPKAWAIGPHFAQHLAFWLCGGAMLGLTMRYLGQRRGKTS